MKPVPLTGAAALLTASVLLMPDSSVGAPVCTSAWCVRHAAEMLGPHNGSLAALGGRTLAQYVTEHQSQVLERQAWHFRAELSGC